MGHPGELKGTTGVGGDQTAGNSITGAVYTFVRHGGTWSQQAFLKAPSPDYDDRLGHALDLSASGDTLAVGAYQEDSQAEDIGGDQTLNGMRDSGAVYLY